MRQAASKGRIPFRRRTPRPFSKRGPRDSKGRSLRDFDLNTRVFRYPLSYMIYTSAFDEMPERVKAYVYGRLVELLSRKDSTTLEILRETKPDFARLEQSHAAR